jgi:ubiquinone/menaquinone biosynthesis C-methylase UbiE
MSYDSFDHYDKYERYGAYHWPLVHPGVRFWKFDPQADANYILALSELRKRLLPVSGRTPRVLDIACGDGVMTYRMRQAGMEVVGLDLELLAMLLARDQLSKRRVSGIPFVRASCMALPFADGSFDGAVAMELIEHIDPALNGTFLSEIRRVLKAGGVVVITTPHKQTPELRSAYHTQEFSGNGLKRLLATSFDAVEVLAYYKNSLRRFYTFGGKIMRPARLVWKTLWKFERLNLFTRVSRTPTVDWEHILAVGNKDPGVGSGSSLPRRKDPHV